MIIVVVSENYLTTSCLLILILSQARNDTDDDCHCHGLCGKLALLFAAGPLVLMADQFQAKADPLWLIKLHPEFSVSIFSVASGVY